VEQILPRDLAGDWVMTWGGGEWNVSLSAFGTYVATRGHSSVWAGTWFLDGPGAMYVTEAWVDENGQRGAEMSWAAVWERDRNGRFDPRFLSGVVRRPDGTTSTSITLRRPRGK
jgi:hypothetical protein